MGPILCIVETDKIGERCYTIYRPEIRINNLLYVDDIVDLGNPMAMENSLRCKATRKEKCFLSAT